MMATKQITRENKVIEFHKAMSLDVDSDARYSLLATRSSLILEEAMEVLDAIDILQMELMRGKKGEKSQWANLLKELADLQYVLSGTLISFKQLNNEFDVAFNRVHKSNMSKLDNDGKPIYNNDGKVLKGPNYKEPNLEDLIY
jgi:predicted HAD superfamily Cof-like phosphohydrolase|tara:strand:- start:12 stop:440 length:429 start_codon:yes stop_codon:yes gene_type:complete